MADQTPMMRQFLEAKAQHPDCLLLFRMGDFYETFFDDAVVAARELDLTLTARDKKSGSPIPMAGVPHHAANAYVRRLVDKGYHVAICEQLEDPATAKGIVRRGVTRVITPGVNLDIDGLDANSNNYLAAVAVSSAANADVTAVAAVDVTTGELRVTELQSTGELLTELRRLAPAEVLIAAPHEALLGPLVRTLDAAITRRDERALSLKRTVSAAEMSVLSVGDKGLPVATLSSTELRERLAVLDAHSLRDRAAVESALSLVLDYLGATQGGVPRSLDAPRIVRSSDYVTLDPASAANLEIFETLMGGKRRGSLVSVVDRTVTAAGARRLRTWLAYPLVDPSQIRWRQGAVSHLVARLETRTRLRDALADCHDIQRLCSKLTAGQGNARDLVTLGTTLQRVPGIVDLLSDLPDPALAQLARELDPCADLSAHIASAVVEEPPLSLTEGGIVRPGYSAELDELIALTTDSKSWLLAFEARERAATGIGSLKVKHNKVFGYYIEVTNANLEQVPDRYIRKQTLVNAERFYTPELKEKEEAILSAAERRSTLEYALFEELRQAVVAQLHRLRATAEKLAELDALAGLAELSHHRNYCCPEIVEAPGITIRGGRHPVVETMTEGERFVPNDTTLSADQRVLIITGPNMAGKSTVIRQVALITLLAQIGSHVPATSAVIGVVDQIFSRVGASDNLARGQSTFMVEMTETAHILSRATSRSLVVLDEIGRGTSTYDGLSIAWAVAEHLHDLVGAFTLFATHYHELTDLARTRPSVRNFNIAAKEWNDRIVFLHTLIEGPANRSYGIQVARLAGVPDPVVERAREVLANLEEAGYGHEDDPTLARTHEPSGPRARKSPQLHLFGEAPPTTATALPAVVTELAELPLDSFSPIEALNTLYALQKRARALERKARD